MISKRDLVLQQLYLCDKTVKTWKALRICYEWIYYLGDKTFKRRRHFVFVMNEYIAIRIMN